MNNYQHIDQQHYLPVFKRFPVTFVRGEGAWLYDENDKAYLDLLAGIAVNALGHNHPKLTEAICSQAQRLMHVSNFFSTPPQALLSKKLSEISGLPRVFLTNSGTESIEGAIKIARKHAFKKGRGHQILTAHRAFHGRTLGALAATAKSGQEAFAPLPEGFKKLDPLWGDDLRRQLDASVAAVLVEPIQGEGGIRFWPEGWLQELQTACHEKQVLLILDEIQTGIGRTGHWFAKDAFGLQPDLMTLAKGLGGGMPVGAVLCSEPVAQSMDYGDHGTTFGGNPLACSAALAVLEVLARPGFLKEVQEKGAAFCQTIERHQAVQINEVRGLGLMIGIELKKEALPVVKELLNQGLVCNATAGNVLRLVPPLTIPKKDWLEAAETIVQTIKNQAFAHA